MIITDAQLVAASGCTWARAPQWLGPLNEAMVAYDINTPCRVAGFLAQLGHESGSLRHVVEIWGPTAAQRGYEGRRDLGNVERGDGSAYRGRGPIQITGRANYRVARDRLRTRWTEVPDFVREPIHMELPVWGARAAADFWQRNGLNELADKHDIDGMSDKINRGRLTPAFGDANGFADRARRYALARAALDC